MHTIPPWRQGNDAYWRLAEITSAVLEAGITAKEWAAVVGMSHQHANMLARTWKKYASRRHERRSFAELYYLAGTSRERAAVIEEVAERENLSGLTIRNYGLGPPAKGKRPDLLKDLVIRQRLLVSVDRAKAAAHYADETTLGSVGAGDPGRRRGTCWHANKFRASQAAVGQGRRVRRRPERQVLLSGSGRTSPSPRAA
jgi:hypothetical protein